MSLSWYDRIKQMYIAIRLEKNPHFYVVVDINRTLKQIRKVLKSRRIERDEIEELVFHIQTLSLYRSIFLKSRSVTYDKTAMSIDVYDYINTVNQLIKRISERDVNYHRKKGEK